MPRIEFVARLVLGVVSVSVAFGTAECVARRTVPVMLSEEYRIPHPVLGWALQPGARYTNHLPEAVQVAYNSTGWRDGEHPIDRRDDRFRIVVLGDSFMEAYSVPFEASFAQRLTALAQAAGWSIEVINLGVGGFGTLQEYLAFRETGRRYSPDLVLLGFYVANDVRNNDLELETIVHGGQMKAMSRPFLELDRSDWTMTQVDFDGAVRRFSEALKRRQAWPLSLMRQLVLLRLAGRQVRRIRAAMRDMASPKAALEASEADARRRDVAAFGVTYCEEPPEFTRAWHTTTRIVARLKREVEAAGSRLIVFTVPARDEVNEAALQQTQTAARDPGRLCLEAAPGYRRLRGIVTDLGIAFIDLLPDFRRATREAGATLFWPAEGHWNRAGHDLAARRVLAALTELTLPAPTGPGPSLHGRPDARSSDRRDR